MTATVIFVCWGNICRSPMAERVARKAAADQGLRGVEFTSAGTSTEEIGNPVDARAARLLTARGYDATDHRAHQITADELAGADLVVVMEELHRSKLESLARSAGIPQALDRVELLSAFDPDAEPGAGVPDPWYGDESGFTDTLAMVEAATPGVLDRVRTLLAD
ncbi:MAG: low molecular weight protein-tyrosine-phosphatase [Propionibacteriaceae bacterium]